MTLSRRPAASVAPEEAPGVLGQERETKALTQFEVRLPGPLDIPASLELFRRSGDDLIDRWDGAMLVRTHPLASGAVAYACQVTGSIEAPALRVTVEDPAHAPLIEQVVRASFVLAPPEFAALLERDAVLARLNAAYPGLRPVRQFDLFAALVRCISAQQVNLRWAVTTRRRLAEAFGDLHQVGAHQVYRLNAERIAGASVSEIRALQFTTRKAEYLIAVAEAIVDGRLDLPTMAALPDEEVIARLTALRGIGRWTAEWILARGLGRACVVAGDLAVRKAIGLAYLDALLPSEAEVRQAVAHWGLSAGVAQALLLHGFAQALG
jgi:DNA-3-methyladenine glycosylase II